LRKNKFQKKIGVLGHCNALFNYLIILLGDMVYVYILYDFDDFVTYL